MPGHALSVRFRPIAVIGGELHNISMNSSDMLISLRSASISERLDASYKLDYSDFADERILAAVRENLSCDDPDLLEISIMRLLIRGRDVQSVELVLKLVEGKRDDEGLIFSSGVRALSGLAIHFPEIAHNILQRFEHLSKTNLDAENISLLENTILELRKLTA